MSSRDLFAAVRERGPRGWSPAVDVFYVGDPPRAIVHVELPGVDPAGVTLEIQGRELLLAGHRPPPEAEGRLYQQIEIEHGPFHRIIPLGADVDRDAAKATYNDGILVVTLPLVRNEPRRRKVSITTTEGDA
jgi:HSP20 family protein